jgi:hypothetical protein
MTGVANIPFSHILAEWVIGIIVLAAFIKADFFFAKLGIVIRTVFIADIYGLAITIALCEIRVAAIANIRAVQVAIGIMIRTVRITAYLPILAVISRGPPTLIRIVVRVAGITDILTLNVLAVRRVKVISWIATHLPTFTTNI